MFKFRNTRRQLASSALTFLILGSVHNAYADGTTELGITQALQAGTVVYVDILDPAAERIRWTGLGSVVMTGPNGASIGTFASGATIVPSGASGRYALTVSANQSTSTAWDISVLNQTTPGGRVFSYDWRFNAASFAQTNASNGSFYAVVPSGGANNTAVIQLKLDGLAGFIYQVNANRSGANGSVGRSLPISGNSVTPEFPLYLKPPTLATYTSIAPSLQGATFRGDTATSVFGTPLACNRFVSGVSTGTFSFVTNGESTYHLSCDINGDGLYSATSSQDVLLIGNASAGLNTISWNGRDGSGAVIAPGNYNCRISLNSGEFHYVGRDIETSYPGMRIFEVSATGARTGLPMFWNDAALQAQDILMPNGSASLQTSGDQGVFSGNYTDPAIPNVNARSWGAFVSNGKGNDAFLDTYVWLSQTVSLPITLTAMDGSIDSDGDGLSDFAEYCTYGTEPTNPDTDGNGVADGLQYKGGTTSGVNGGLESNGRMSLAIARRSIASYRKVFKNKLVSVQPEIRIKNETNGTMDAPSDTDAPSTEALASILESSDLATLLPAVGPRGAVARISSPVDLPEVTNAKAVSARDYIDADGTSMGTVMLIETVGEVYEHSKAVCDRAHGAQLTDIARGGNNAPYLRAETVQREARDRSISLMIYEDKSDQGVSFVGVSRWLVADYPKPKEGQRVLAVQVWSRRPGDEELLVASLLANVAKRGSFAWSSPTVQAGIGQADTGAARLPGVYVTSARALGQGLALDVRNMIQSEAQATARLQLEDGTFKEVTLTNLSSKEAQHHDFTLPPFLEAMVDISSGGRVVDKVWLSDGTWIPMGARLAGSLSPTGFTTLECLAQDGDYRQATTRFGVGAGAIRLSGCGKVDAQGGLAGGVARTLSGGGLDLSTFGGVMFRAKSSHPFKVCLESTSVKAAACATLPASPEQQWYYVKNSDLVSTQTGLAPTTSVSLVNFETLGTMEVAGLTFARDPLGSASAPAAEATSGCSVSASHRFDWQSVGLPALVMALTAGFRTIRRKRRHERPQS
jgi:hypothetical protein